MWRVACIVGNQAATPASWSSQPLSLDAQSLILSYNLVEALAKSRSTCLHGENVMTNMQKFLFLESDTPLKVLVL